jgi:GDP-4-dehydro-6-deoxy-D-mannose reductase
MPAGALVGSDAVRVLITGVTGFAGRHLAAHCRAAGDEVHGLVRPGRAGAAPPGIAAHEADLLRPDAVRAVLARVGPDCVLHLAGAASVGQSFGAPLPTWHANLLGTLGLLEALRLEGSPARCVAVSSGEVYGRVAPEDLPVGPDTPMRPVSPYGASKAAADVAAGQYRAGYGLQVVRVRAFNHIGPGQDPRFVVPSVARQIALAEARGQAAVEVRLGNLAARRDFTDVRDMVRAYRLLAERGDPDRVYLACSGRSLSIQEVVDVLAALARCEVRIVSEPGRLRRGEAPDLYGSPAQLTADTGWRPEIPLAATLADTLDWWRAAVTRAGRPDLEG